MSVTAFLHRESAGSGARPRAAYVKPLTDFPGFWNAEADDIHSPETHAEPARQPFVTPEGEMVTSGELVHDIRKLDGLISLMTRSYPWDAEDIEDFVWMQSRRDELRTLLDLRRAEQRNKVIRLSVWRDGAAAKSPDNRAAA
jgi:hypothetical protein